LKIVDSSNRRAVAALLSPERVRDAATDRQVAAIVGEVRAGGDAALRRLARKFDRLDGPIEVSRAEMERAAATVPRAVRAAIRTAARHIRTVARRQVPRGWRATVAPGVTVEQRVVPLDRVGCYVPGGRYPLPSSLLMTAIPAKVAGVADVVAACPRPEPVVMAAALEAGVSRLFRVGGAHAVAAMAYGTKTIPQVDKIVGPGNIFVATAKRMVFGEVDIDSIAGPSEILVLVDNSADPVHVAADMLSQAEHDELAAALCITTSSSSAQRIQTAIEDRLRRTKRQAITLQSLKKYGAIIVARGIEEMIELANDIAPEHIELIVKEPEKLAARIHNAGAIFLGAYSAPPLGDYLAGPNHVLPTGGSARFFSPLGTYDFLKRTSIIRAERRALKALAPTITHLARLEGLDDHARSVEARFREGL